MSVATLPRTRKREHTLAWVNRQKYIPQSTVQAAALDSVYPDWRKTLNGAWFTSLEEAEAFVKARGFFPRAKAQDLAEKTLGIWLATQRYRAGLLSPDRLDLLNSRLPGWNKSKDEAWNERLDEVCAIAARLGRIPGVTDKDAEVRRAGVWLRKYAKSPLGDPQVVVLNDRLPGWNDSGFDARWVRNMDALVAFLEVHGRFPSQHEEDRDARRLGVWLHSRRQGIDTLSQCRRDELTRRAPGWDRSADDKWDENLEFVATYFTEHGAFPSDHSKDPVVAAAGRWMRIQRSKRSSMSQRRTDALDARLPGWQRNKDEKWEAMLDFVAGFMHRNGRFPSWSASAGSEERGAAIWLQRQRKGTGMTSVREAMLDERIPSWRETADDLWFRNLSACEAFYKKNGRRAVSTSTDAEERRLAIWFNNASRATMSEERAAAFAAADLGDLRSRDQVWADTLDLVSAFRAAHGRFPTATGKVPGERTLATWLTNHRQGKAAISQERRTAMNARIPEWDLTLEDIWRLKLQACVGFVQLHGRLPSSGKNAGEAEKKSAEWVGQQRKAKRVSRPDREAILDEQLPGWRG